MPPELVAWLVLGFLALVAFHELTHVLIAAAHDHPTVCVAINRDFAVLRKLPSRVLFTRHGRTHWRHTWLAGTTAADRTPTAA